MVWPRREEREKEEMEEEMETEKIMVVGPKYAWELEAKAKVNKMWTRMVRVLFSFERSEKAMNEGRENIEGACRCKRRKNEGVREGGREGGREGEREGERKGGREGERKGGREGERKGGREGGREGGRKERK